MKHFLLLMMMVAIMESCTIQKQRGVRVSKTSSYLGTFARVDSCNPVLQWEGVNMTEYQAELDKSLQYLEEEVKKANAAALSQPQAISNTVMSSHPKTISYDLVIYEALKPPHPNVPWGAGRRIFYREGIQETSLRVEPPLNPQSKYFWSVRVRLPDGRVYPWSTYNKTTVLPGSLTETSNLLFGIKTPGKCGE